MKVVTWSRWFNTMSIALIPAAINAIVLLSSPATVAQITPDRTLGSERSTLNRNVMINGRNGNRIEGGARRGANLFHSFERFNVSSGQRLYFANPEGVVNIIGRITGQSRSTILGTLGVEGTANLFLINPNGIVFGRNATLDVRGSFVATTASALRFADGTEFRATEATANPSLTVSAPIGLQFGTHPGSIRVQGDGQGLRSGSGNGDGGSGDGNGGGNGGSGDGNGNGNGGGDGGSGNGGSGNGGSGNGGSGDGSGNGNSGGDRAEINNALRVPANQTLALVGGSIISTGGTLKTSGGQIELGSVRGAGFVTLTPNQRGFVLSYDNQTAFGDIQLLRATSVDASGQAGGDIRIQARQVILQGGSAVEATTLGNSAGGTVRITALEGVELSGTTADNPQDPRRFVTSISADNRGAGTIPGELAINTAQLTIRNGARISASNTREGVGGNININATDFIELVGTGISPGGRRSSGISVQTRGTGSAGNVTITTQRLLVRAGAEVSASTFGAGAGGNVDIQAAERIDLIGASRDRSLRSRLVAEVGNPDEVGRGNDRIPVQATGQGGDVNVTTNQLTVREGAAVSASSRSRTGRAGNLNLTANAIMLDQGRLTVQTRVGSGAEITLQELDSLRLRNNSLISAQAFDSATGGNVTVNAPDGFVVALPNQNSDIIASAEQGRGGNIAISAQGIFGIEPQQSLPQNQTNDIDASSQFNQSGTVTINQPDVDPSRGLIELPVNVVDRATQIARGCTPRDNGSDRFVSTGRGGLPLSPDQPLRDRAIIPPGWITLDSDVGDSSVEQRRQDDRSVGQNDFSENTFENSTENMLIEANRFSRDANGKIVLVAQLQSNDAVHVSNPVCR